MQKFDKFQMVNKQPSAICHQLKCGNLVAYPTETVWGIGCDGFCKKAVMDLLSIKNRPIDKGLIVLTDKIERILPFLQPLPADRQQKIVQTWQNNNQIQATTWLFPIPKSITIPYHLTGKHQSLAIRVINHSAVADICRGLVGDDNPYGFLVSSSCNPSGLPPATNLSTAQAYFGDKSNVLFLDGETLGLQKPSQILCAVSGQVLRA